MGKAAFHYYAINSYGDADISNLAKHFNSAQKSYSGIPLIINTLSSRNGKKMVHCVEEYQNKLKIISN